MKEHIAWPGPHSSIVTTYCGRSNKQSINITFTYLVHIWRKKRDWCLMCRRVYNSEQTRKKDLIP